MASSADVCDVVSELYYLLGQWRTVTDLAASIGKYTHYPLVYIKHIVVTQVLIPVNSMFKEFYILCTYDLINIC